MKLTEDGWILSDSGHTLVLKWRNPETGKEEIGYCQHSIVEYWLSEEDKRMAAEPEVVWEEFFRQQTASDSE